MIDAVAEVMRAAPTQALPALVPARQAIANLYGRARGLLTRDAVVAEDATDIVGLPTSTSGRFSAIWLTFFLFVLAPALAGAIYFGLIASEQYVAEIRFVVRFGQRDPGPSLGGGAGGMAGALGGMASRTGSSTEDAYIVTSYIRSRTIVDDLSKQIDLREMFNRPEADFLARLGRTASIDQLREYWQKRVATFVESSSGIVTVEVRAFRPEDAVLISTHVEQLAERLINDISARARRDAVRRASEELDRAHASMYEALREMESYRNAEGLIDPVQAATDTSKILNGILAEQLSTENQLFVARQSLGADSPSVRNLQVRMDSLRRQTTALREQLAGNKGEARNVAAALARYEEVAVKQKMAEALYGLAVSGLDRARMTAESQALYLTTFVHPRLPEEYSYPSRFFFPVAIALSCFVLWSIGMLVRASIEDHRTD